MLVLMMLAMALGAPVPGRNEFPLRGQRQDIYYLPGARGGQSASGKVLFAPGDGGWRGFAITMAKTVAGWGYDVFGIDTKRYLESFTGSTTLKEPEVMADFRAVAQWIGPGGCVHLMGWSEGAGLVLLAAAAEENRRAFCGVMTISLGESSVLGWRTVDNITWITKRQPNEPTFSSLPYMAKVSSLPLVMIHATGDEYTPQQAARKLFESAGEPKRFSLIPARNHHFDGGQDEFFRALREGLEWMSKQKR
jgi:dienelactone hydrolase